jgi:subtilisin-like proprotein convertase family protein
VSVANADSDARDPLSRFDGKSIAGTWRLNVVDNELANAGTLVHWCLEVK